MNKSTVTIVSDMGIDLATENNCNGNEHALELAMSFIELTCQTGLYFAVLNEKWYIPLEKTATGRVRYMTEMIICDAPEGIQ